MACALAADPPRPPGLGPVGGGGERPAARGGHPGGVLGTGRRAAADRAAGLAVAALDALRALPRAHHPLVLGAAAAAAGADPADAAALAVHHLVGGACTAAVRLLGLDPLRVAAVAAEIGRAAEPVVARPSATPRPPSPPTIPPCCPPTAAR